jgi:fermentation-respiration switch protein FrsA (DUF1100 family)
MRALLVALIAAGLSWTQSFKSGIGVLLLLDTSTSMTGSLDDVQAAARAFLARLAPDDSVRLGTFSDRLRLGPAFLSVDDPLLAHLPIAREANMTSLYDSLIEACDSFEGETGRRVVVVLSEGADTASAAAAKSVMQRATQANVTIYAVDLSSRFLERGRSGDAHRAGAHAGTGLTIARASPCSSAACSRRGSSFADGCWLASPRRVRRR